MISKEIKEILRDRASFFLLIIIPVVNFAIVGYSINTDPRNLPTAIIDYDNSLYSRSIIAGMRNTGYFDIEEFSSEQAAEEKFKSGELSFIVLVSDGFSKKLRADEDAELYIEVDASDPAATANALNALQTLIATVIQKDRHFSPTQSGQITLTIHRLYNPEVLTKLNIVPGLTGVIVSVVLILMPCLSFLRERKGGTIVHIMNSRLKCFEIILGKSIPYFIVGILQSLLLIGFSVMVMDVEIQGSFFALLSVMLFFNLICIASGIIISVVCQTQLQATQITSFYFLLSNMLSGFISPFVGMPVWSKFIGEMLPLTYYLRLAKGIILKGYTLTEMAKDFYCMSIMSLLFVIASYLLFCRALSKAM